MTFREMIPFLVPFLGAVKPEHLIWLWNLVGTGCSTLRSGIRWAWRRISGARHRDFEEEIARFKEFKSMGTTGVFSPSQAKKLTKLSFDSIVQMYDE